MKYFYYTVMTALAIHLALITSSAAELEDRFKGRISLGFMAINSGDNLVPDSSEEYLGSLSSAADKESSFLPIILPEAIWDVGEKEGVKLFFDTAPPIDKAGSFVLNLGTAISSAGGTIYQVSLFGTPFEKAWKNPYLVGVRREETDTSKYGVKFAFNRILGSGFRVNLVYMNDDVDDDEIGATLPDMARDGNIYALTGNYSYYPSESLEIRPELSLRLGEYDGDSSSFTKYKASLKASYMSGKFMVAPEFWYSYTEYDEIDRVFNEERDNNAFGITLLVNYLAPFGYKDFSIMGLVGYSQGDSSIEFYDSEAENFGLFLTYHF